MNTFIHQLCKQQPGLGMSAYWSAVTSLNVFNSDRTPEITLGFLEGAGYA